MNVVIVGGHGKVALELSKLLTADGHHVKSIIRNPEQSKDVEEAGANPVLLSLEDSPPSAFSAAFEDSHIVYFSAGAGGQGGAERTKKVDYEGALKVFDAIELLSSPTKPRLIMVSSLGSHDPNVWPDHYDEVDKRIEERIRPILGDYLHWKYEADKNLASRSQFSWTIVRPGGLSDEPAKGRASVGRAHLTGTISRADVAQLLFLLASRPNASGLGIDINGGEVDLAVALDVFINEEKNTVPS